MAALVPWNKVPAAKGDVPVAVISLPDATGRRAALVQRGIPADFVNGFWPARDMRDVADPELHSYREYHDIKERYGRAPVSAELGCFFSHSAVIRWLAEQDKFSQAVVFEDDVVPESSRCLDALRDLAGALAGPADSGAPFICHLGPRPGDWRGAFTRRISIAGSTVPGVNLVDFVDKTAGLWRAHAYIISREAAQRYVEATRRSAFLADDWRFITDQTMSRMILVTPRLFAQDEEADSTIDPERERALRNSEKDFGKSVEHAAQNGGSVLERYCRSILVRFCRALPGKRLYR